MSRGSELEAGATEVHEEAERAALHDVIRFGSFDLSHPIFRLDLSGALWVYWENVGQPSTRAVRRRWRAGR